MRFLFVIVFLLSACGSNSVDMKVANVQVPLSPVYGDVQVPQTTHSIDLIELDMTQEQVRSAMGKPDKINVSIDSRKPERYPETWIYSGIKCFQPDTRPNTRTTYSGKCSVGLNTMTKKVIEWDKGSSRAIVIQNQCIRNCI